MLNTSPRDLDVVIGRHAAVALTPNVLLNIQGFAVFSSERLLVTRYLRSSRSRYWPVWW
jgi:hypothetical protein